MSEEENALTQAGRELLDNTTHHFEEVETRTGTTIQWYDHLKNVDIDTNRMIGLTNMELYTRLIHYAQKNGGYVPKVSQQRGSCLFHSMRKGIACPREFSNSHLRRMIICFIVDNFQLLWPMLHFAIKGNYGHLRLSPEQFREKESQGTLTDKEREEYLKLGPFSVVTYLENLMRQGFYREEICLLIISMMWKIQITIINGQTLTPIKIHHRNPAMKGDMVLVHCSNAHYIPLCESFLLSSLILVLNVSSSRCIVTYICGIVSSSNDVATSPFCVMTINRQFLLVLCFQCKSMMQKMVRGTSPGCGQF